MSRVVRLAVLGDPLAYTRSPELHRAALAALGLAGDSRALRTPPAALGPRLEQFAAEGVTGFNVTHPLKEPVIAHLSRVAPDAALARSVNTVGRAGSGWWGDSTDGPGFVDWLGHLGLVPARERVLIFGAGGAARSIALAMHRAGAEPVRVATRGGAASVPPAGAGSPHGADAARRESADVARDAWSDLKSQRVMLAPDDLDRVLEEWASVVVNATPLADADGPRAPRSLPGRARVLDLVYGATPTAWVRAARACGLEAHDGLGLLAFQARRSLSLWLGSDVPLAPLLAAAGLAP